MIIEKAIGLNDFRLWRLKMCAFLVQQGLLEVLLESKFKFNVSMAEKDKKKLLEKVHNTIFLASMISC